MNRLHLHPEKKQVSSSSSSSTTTAFMATTNKNDVDDDDIKVKSPTTTSPITTTTIVDGVGMWKSWTRVFDSPEAACLDLIDNCFDAIAIVKIKNDDENDDDDVVLDFDGRIEMSSSISSSNSSNSMFYIMNNCHTPCKSLRDALTVYKSNKNTACSSNGNTTTNNNNNSKSRSNTTKTKNEKDTIGENGVGLKQGCATLSDCSICITRNNNNNNSHTVEIGIIARDLQSSSGVYLPSCTFFFDDLDNDTASHNDCIQRRIRRWLGQHPTIRTVLSRALRNCNDTSNSVTTNTTDDGTTGGVSFSVEDQLTRFVLLTWEDGWDGYDHVFLLVICNIRKGAADVPHRLMSDAHSSGGAFLRQIRTMIPEYYINLPLSSSSSQNQKTHGQNNNNTNFSFVIDGESVQFNHWQHRLVELTKFTVPIPLVVPFDQLPVRTWDELQPKTPKQRKRKLPQPSGTTTTDNDNSNCIHHNDDSDDDGLVQTYTVDIYCGLDARRVQNDIRNKRGTSTCHLMVYSCPAGRLITRDVDARYVLGLGSSGVDYSQGLTVIINDVRGHLPLTPTKDGIAWSEQRRGNVHRRNLFAWAGAVAQFYWRNQLNFFANHWTTGRTNGRNRTKEVMKYTIQSYATTTAGGGIDGGGAGGDHGPDNDNRAAVVANMKDANFTVYQGIKWKRDYVRAGDRWRIRNASFRKKVAGPDTLLKLRPPEARNGGNDSSRRANGKRRRSAGGHTGATTAARSLYDEIFQEEPPPEWDGRYQPWHEIAVDDFERVTKGVLSYFRGLDEFDIFEDPVIEALPDLKEAYLDAISNPMDFRTIEQVRLPTYTSITELQKDLVLTFENCIAFNGADSDFGFIARRMLANLDEAFSLMDVKKVTKRVLECLRGKDRDGLFELPVVEAHPDLKDAYLRAVSIPMDFKTIECERVHSYTSTSQLKQDLVSVFQNCIQFNGAESRYGKTAQKMLDELDASIETAMSMTTEARRKRKRARKILYDDDLIEEECIPYNPSRKRKPNSKKSSDTERRLCETQKQLEAERTKNLQLSNQLAEYKNRIAARDERIRQLERRQQGAPASVQQPQTSTGNSQDEGCQMCGKDNDHENLMLCEICDVECHYYCVDPPLSGVPDGDWYCDRCTEVLKSKGSGTGDATAQGRSSQEGVAMRTDTSCRTEFLRSPGSGTGEARAYGRSQEEVATRPDTVRRTAFFRSTGSRTGEARGSYSRSREDEVMPPDETVSAATAKQNNGTGEARGAYSRSQEDEITTPDETVSAATAKQNNGAGEARGAYSRSQEDEIMPPNETVSAVTAAKQINSRIREL